MKIQIQPARDHEWTWFLVMDNGRPLAKGNDYLARGDAVGAALRTVGLALPNRPKGCKSQTHSSVPQPRGGTAYVHVLYGSGGKVRYAQWDTLMETIELVES